MTNSREIQRRAKLRFAALRRAQRDPRYQRVLGRYLAAGVLETTMNIEPHTEPISVEETLWAGRIEPRVLELLPSLIVKRPAIFSDIRNLPEDLAATVRALRTHRVPPDFRGLPGASIGRWLPLVGHRGKLPSRLKSFRMQAADLELLERLSNVLEMSHTDVIRAGLRQLAAARLLAGPGDEASPRVARG